MLQCLDMETPHLSEFELFYDRTSDNLYRHVLFKTSDSDIASDIVQEAFIRVYKCWHTYESAEHTIRALYTITRNLVTDHYRHKKRTQNATDAMLHALPSTGTAPDEYIHEHIATKQLLAILQRLNETERHVVVSHSINDISYAEISRELQKPEPTIRKIHSRTLKKIKQLFHSFYGINYLPY